MHNRFLVAAVMLMASVAYAQNCDVAVSDAAGVLGSGSAAVESAARELTSQGADVRVITVGGLSGTLDQYVANTRKACSSWQSPGGGMKNNLVVFALAPFQRKFGIFYGSEWKEVLDSSAPAIKSQFMAPAFKDADWGRGLANGEVQITNRIKALNEAALHPAQNTTTVTNQATDFSGFWTFLWWVLGLSVIGTAVFGTFVFYSDRAKRKQEMDDAQQEAQSTAAAVADKMAKIFADLSEKKALGEDVTRRLGTLAYIQEDYSRLAGSESFNPSSDGRSVNQYKTMSLKYGDLLKQLNNLQDDGPVVRTKISDVPPPSTSRHASSKPYRSYAPTATPTPTPAPVSTHTTTIIDNSGPGFIPIYIPEERPYRQPDPEPSYTPSYSSSRSSSSDDDSGCGSSSSWSSSSDSDSGSSSSFDSGSSDSGGGSSSDF